MIHICYALRDISGKYSKFVGTSIQSLLENTREKVTIHVIHDSTLSHGNRKKLISIVYQFDQEIEFHAVDFHRLENAKQISLIQQIPERLTMFYRLMIPEILSGSKAIYLDADTIINLDINELWAIDLSKYPLAVVTEMSAGAKSDAWKMWQTVCDGTININDEFNAGVLLMNLDLIRKNCMEKFSGGGDLLDRSIQILLEHPNYWLLDQDALNTLFAKNSLKLPPKFNRMLGWKKSESVGAEIYHYVLRTLTLNTKDQFCRLWFEYFLKTPFATPDSFGNLFESMAKSSRQKNDLLRKLIQLAEQKSNFVIRLGNLDLNLSKVTSMQVIKRDEFLDITSLLNAETKFDACEILKEV